MFWIDHIARNNGTANCTILEKRKFETDGYQNQKEQDHMKISLEKSTVLKASKIPTKIIYSCLLFFPQDIFQLHGKYAN